MHFWRRTTEFNAPASIVVVRLRSGAGARLCRLKCPRFGPRRDGPDWLVRLRAVLDRKRHVCQRCAGFFARRSLTMNDGEGTALAAPFLPVPVCCNVSRMPHWIPIAVLFAAA